jgi:putative hydrolase of the HAD superfamily
MVDKKLPKAILLDLDDTIIAFSNSVDPSWRKVCEEFANQIGNLTAEVLFTAIKECRTWYWGNAERNLRKRCDLKTARREIVIETFVRLGIHEPILAQELADAYTKERDAPEAIWLIPGAIKTLRYFKEQGSLLALVTNGSMEAQRRKIEQFGLAEFFDCIVIEGEFGVGKPNERIYLYALEQLGVDAKEAWMVGDDLEWDVAGAQRLGIRSIWIDYQGSGLPESSSIQPDWIVRSLSELVGTEGIG